MKWSFVSRFCMRKWSKKAQNDSLKSKMIKVYITENIERNSIVGTRALVAIRLLKVSPPAVELSNKLTTLYSIGWFVSKRQQTDPYVTKLRGQVDY